MGVRFNIDNEKIEVVLENNFSVDDAISVVEDAISQISSPLPLLADVTHSTELNPAQDLERFADFLGKKRNNFGPRVAILVAHKVRYGTGRQIGAHFGMHDIDSHPFYDKTQALKWLLEE